MAIEVVEVAGRAVRVSHRRGSPTVLFLHGYPDTLHVFDRAISALDGNWGYVAPDFPGQGRSEASGTVAPEARARWLDSLLRVLDVDRVRLVAHDMGAHAALELALGFPDRVESLVLSHSLLDGTAKTSRTIALLRRGRAYRWLLPAFPSIVVARSLASFLPSDTPLTDDVHDDIAACFTRAVARTTVAVCDAAEVWLARGLDRFGALRCPVTLVWGSAETHFGRAHAESLARVCRATSIVDVDGGHHWLAWQQPRSMLR